MSPHFRLVSCLAARLTMAGLLDSVAVFEQRATEIGLSGEEIARMTAKSWNTLARVAFACGYTPGQADESSLLKLARVVTDTPESSPLPDDRMPLIRRLFVEAYTLSVTDLKARTERREDDAPRKLATAERDARYHDQVRRLAGLNLRGEMEPSNALVDIVQDMYESNALQYVRWEQCTKRDQELMGVRVDPIWKPDARGVVRETAESEQLRADTSTDLLLSYALKRRSLAFDQCRLIRYEVMERWSQILLDSFLRSPPAGYRAVSLEQLHTADLELFRHLMGEARGRIRPGIDGSLPLEPIFLCAITLPEIRLFLQPLPGSSSSSSSTSNRGPTKRRAESDSEARLKRQVTNLENRLKNLQDGGAGGKGNSRSKAKGKAKARSKNGGNAVRLPESLRGLDADGPDGPRCFDFNLSGCSGAKPGERCRKGYHQCMKCGGKHSQRDCRQ